MKMKKLFASAMALALTVCCALSLTGCSAKINSIGLPTDELLEKGDTLALEISYGTEDETTEEKLAEAVSKLTLVWTSTDETVATVDETGLVTAVGPGEADVSVSIQARVNGDGSFLKVNNQDEKGGQCGRAAIRTVLFFCIFWTMT